MPGNEVTLLQVVVFAKRFIRADMFGPAAEIDPENCCMPNPLANVGVTVIVAVTGVVPVFTPTKEAMLPVPLAASPMDVLSLVQL